LIEIAFSVPANLLLIYIADHRRKKHELKMFEIYAASGEKHTQMILGIITQRYSKSSWKQQLITILH
jgi:hypothetical protein